MKSVVSTRADERWACTAGMRMVSSPSWNRANMGRRSASSP